MTIVLRILEDGEETFVRGKPAEGNVKKRSVRVDGKVLEIEIYGAPGSGLKSFAEFVESRFREDPDSIKDIASLLADFLLEERPSKDALGKILVRLRTLTGGISAVILAPFILVRTASQTAGYEKPYRLLDSEGMLALPIEKYKRYSGKIRTGRIDSELIYLSVSDEIPSGFFERLHERLLGSETFKRELEESLEGKRGKKNKKVYSLFERFESGLKAAIGALSDVSSVDVKCSGLSIENSKLRPLCVVKITPVQLPPALDKDEYFRVAREYVMSEVLGLFSEILNITPDELGRYVDLSGIEIDVNIRGFCETINRLRLETSCRNSGTSW